MVEMAMRESKRCWFLYRYPPEEIVEKSKTSVRGIDGWMSGFES